MNRALPILVASAGVVLTALVGGYLAVPVFLLALVSMLGGALVPVVGRGDSTVPLARWRWLAPAGLVLLVLAGATAGTWLGHTWVSRGLEADRQGSGGYTSGAELLTAVLAFFAVVTGLAGLSGLRRLRRTEQSTDR